MISTVRRFCYLRMALKNSVENNVLNEEYFGNMVYIMLQLRPFFNEMDKASSF